MVYSLRGQRHHVKEQDRYLPSSSCGPATLPTLPAARQKTPRWRLGAAIKANPLRGGGAKPKGLFLRRTGSRATERWWAHYSTPRENPTLPRVKGVGYVHEDNLQCSRHERRTNVSIGLSCPLNFFGQQYSSAYVNNEQER